MHNVLFLNRNVFPFLHFSIIFIAFSVRLLSKLKKKKKVTEISSLTYLRQWNVSVQKLDIPSNKNSNLASFKDHEQAIM